MKDKKIILIVTTARTGSTLLQGIVNTIDDSLINGENHGVFIRFWKSLCDVKKILEIPQEEKSKVTSPWYNPDLSVDKFIVSLRETAMSILDSTGKHRVVGFKETRYERETPRENLEEYVDFLQNILFEGAYVIFLTRDSKEVFQSRGNMGWNNNSDMGWQQSPEDIEDFFKFIRALDGERRFVIDYSQIKDDSKLSELFEFLDEKYDRSLVSKVLGKLHSCSSIELAGKRYYHGLGDCEKDDKKAFACWSKGAELGSTQCMILLAWAYNEGIGCERNEAEYKRWSDRANE